MDPLPEHTPGGGSMATSPGEESIENKQFVFNVELTKELGQNIGIRIGRQGKDNGIFILAIVSIGSSREKFSYVNIYNEHYLNVPIKTCKRLYSSMTQIKANTQLYSYTAPNTDLHTRDKT